MDLNIDSICFLECVYDTISEKVSVWWFARLWVMEGLLCECEVLFLGVGIVKTGVGFGVW